VKRNTGTFWNRPDEWALYEPLHGTRMLELGGKINGTLTYKAHFESLGFEHISVDWNGEHGALIRDLRKPLVDELGQFDMVSNMGCTEHVSGQSGVWRNIHEMTRTGGVYVGQTPYYDGLSWWWHGEWYPTEDFFLDFAERNGWTVERLYKGNQRPNENLYCRMEKTKDLPFDGIDTDLIVRNVKKARSWRPTSS